MQRNLRPSPQLEWIVRAQAVSLGRNRTVDPWDDVVIAEDGERTLVYTRDAICEIGLSRGLQAAVGNFPAAAPPNSNKICPGMTIESSYNFVRVSDRLTTSGFVSPDALKILGAQGYEVVVNLLPDEHQYAVPGERGILESQGIEYVYIPVDFAEPTRADFERFSETLDGVREKKVHVHCAANWRVTAFYSLYEVCRGRWTSEQATEFMHRVWSPAEHAGWPEFIAEISEHAEQGATAGRHGSK